MTSSPGETGPNDLAAAAAAAAALVLPSATQLTAGPAQPGSPHVTAVFAGAAIAELEGPVPGRVAVLVGQDLVDALAESPLGGLDLAAATQPALEAAANRLGAHAAAARQVQLDLVVGDMAGEFTTVPLIGAGIAAALLVPNATLEQARSHPSAVPADAPNAAPASSTAPGGFEAPSAQTSTVNSASNSASAAGAVTPPPGSGAPIGMAPIPQPRPAAAGQQPVQPVTYAPGVAPAFAPARGIEMLHGVDMEVTVELGRTRMTVRDLLALAPGAVLELDRAAGSPADLLVNGRLIARGEVVVVDEDFGLRVTEIIDAAAAASA